MLLALEAAHSAAAGVERKCVNNTEEVKDSVAPWTNEDGRSLGK